MITCRVCKTTYPNYMWACPSCQTTAAGVILSNTTYNNYSSGLSTAFASGATMTDNPIIDNGPAQPKENILKKMLGKLL